MTAVVLALLLIALVAAMLIGSEPDRSPASEAPTPGAGFETREVAQTRGTRDWAEPVAAGALLAALLILAIAIVVAERRRRTRARTAEAPETVAVMQALDESLDDLRRERDIRRAIIACYARMERALERAGSRRHPADAPFDYLARVMERITANGRAARVLTELFERAKFSIEPMGEPEKQQAIRALELLRAEVARPL